jgi:rhamnopyranosyl-N-acetylglucosaminyl-diphospho-decaprenol beta-1,3/1,4-galactofuranosyltransferase
VRILAAVVTYNREALLARCVDHIRAQSRPPDRLLVINNNSTDGTVRMLETKGIDYVTQPNLGSAGGWARAIDEAIAGGFDAVWLMDDDGYPDPAALGVLERSLTPGVGCVSSVVLKEAQPTHFVFPFPKLNRHGYPALAGRPRKVGTLTELQALAQDGLYPFAHLFNGALVSVGTARAIGNVSREYFLSGDEVDYFMRLQRSAPVFSHVDARHYHPDVTTRPLTPEKFYYYLKNTIILHNRYFDRKPVRNLLAVAAVLARTAARNSPATALSYVAGRHAPVLWRAIARGLKGRLGKDFDG